MIRVTHFTDPGCPWAYSAWPALTVLQWRYRDQLDWKHVTIGLSEDGEDYVRRGFDTAREAAGRAGFRRFGMPLQLTPKARMSATSPACRAIVATRLAQPELEVQALRALQFRQFTTTDILDESATLAAALRRVAGLDVDAILARLDDADVREAYEADKAHARTAEGGPTHFQGKAANSDGAVRFTAPSLVFTGEDGRSLEAGGFQTIEAYDVLIANLDATLDRRGHADDPVDVLAEFPYALTTAELAAVLAPPLEAADPHAAELALIDAVADGRVTREQLGDGSLWSLAVETQVTAGDSQAVAATA